MIHLLLPLLKSFNTSEMQAAMQATLHKQTGDKS